MWKMAYRQTNWRRTSGGENFVACCFIYLYSRIPFEYILLRNDMKHSCYRNILSYSKFRYPQVKHKCNKYIYVQNNLRNKKHSLTHYKEIIYIVLFQVYLNSLIDCLYTVASLGCCSLIRMFNITWVATLS